MTGKYFFLKKPRTRGHGKKLDQRWNGASGPERRLYFRNVAGAQHANGIDRVGENVLEIRVEQPNKSRDAAALGDQSPILVAGVREIGDDDSGPRRDVDRLDDSGIALEELNKHLRGAGGRQGIAHRIVFGHVAEDGGYDGVQSAILAGTGLQHVQQRRDATWRESKITDEADATADRIARKGKKMNLVMCI